MKPIGKHIKRKPTIKKNREKEAKNALKEKMPWWALALKYERVFTQAYKELNVLPPTYEPRATGHVTQMIELIEKLMASYVLQNKVEVTEKPVKKFKK